MKRSFQILAVSLLFAVSLAAQNARVTLDPPAPTSNMQIEARVFAVCTANSTSVARVGSAIRINIQPGPDLCDPPIPSLTRVPIGMLIPGEYLIEVTVGESTTIVTSRRFIVRDSIQRGADIHPFAVPVDPFGLRLRVTSAAKINRVFIDDLEVPPATFTRESEGVTFPAPAHERGLVDVEVWTDAGTIGLPAALYYFDFAGPIDNSVFERILFPVLFESAGAHGSHWVSEAAIANPKPWFIENENEVLPYVCLGYPCGERLHPNTFLSFEGLGYPRGVALIAPRAESDNLAFSLRVRDTARQAEGYGTQVPVVREDEMFRNTELTLLDIPVDPRYRTKLRMYAFDTGDHEAFVTIDRAGSAPSDTIFVPVRRNCEAFECESIPWYGELDLPAGAINERVNVYVTIGGADSPAWAFASVTNNETQQVTIVTADGQGGRP